MILLKRASRTLWLAPPIARGLLLACAGPATSTPAPPPATPMRDLADAKRTLDQMESKWEGQVLTDCRFQFRWDCFCPPGLCELVWVTVGKSEMDSIRAVGATRM